MCLLHSFDRLLKGWVLKRGWLSPKAVRLLWNVRVCGPSPLYQSD
jgi:hypothetical protein